MPKPRTVERGPVDRDGVMKAPDYFQTDDFAVDQAGRKAAALALWNTGLFDVAEIANQLDIAEGTVKKWKANWPKREEIIKLSVDPIVEQIQQLRSEKLLDFMRREVDAIDADLELLDAARQKVSDGVEVSWDKDGCANTAANRPKETREYIAARAAMQKRVSELLGMDHSVAKAAEVEEGDDNRPTSFNLSVVTEGKAVVQVTNATKNR